MKKDNWLNDREIKSELKEYLSPLILETLGGLIILDENCRIIYINDLYADSMCVDKETSIHKHITEVVEDTRLPIVSHTKKSEIGVIYKRKNKAFIVNRYPLIKDGNLIGIVGLSTFEDHNHIEMLNTRIQSLEKELSYYKEKKFRNNPAKYSIDDIVTKNKYMIQLKELTYRVASKKSSVLISGESGTGKELFAHSIHSLSNRYNKSFVRINCAAIPESLLESELFGYEKGAFTGALKEGKMGDFEIANGGTIMMDEIDSLPLYLQSKLLRVLQEKEIKKVGGSRIIPIDVRMIFTTNRDLLELSQRGEFREDLYYRINVVNLSIPPLRERVDDIPILVNRFIKKYNSELGMNISGISDEAIKLLSSYEWPGNVRELENSIERAFIYAVNGILGIEHFHLYINKPNNLSGSISKSSKNLSEIRYSAEKKAIIEALVASRWNKKKAAELLGIDRSVLYYKMKKYNINEKI
ncbi:sigma-54 interaction domain-containing protein [Maledivibacter halophilus]|uniref:Transcriptional regulator containing PAS, AAA-type ATPase, and DNA-binding Fis domains n=1 Tax=Maledivibacter halophilus TaxID=36842 RepID=A0A1T5MVU7_9FIRM|nr:sigma 54-interacting transcriptional regulator [Maledivibacter halophilus]SKC92361.1 Transcriptional regulator containing PAS, AAA-type ATPase, and DNA-binding Fis domains [Maledivibacter halophilus]